MKNKIILLLILLQFILVSCMSQNNTYNSSIDFSNAQNHRIDELAELLEQSIGRWKCEELIVPMAIGQDSTRNQLGIELQGMTLEISEDYTVTLEDEAFVIQDVIVRDYGWYLEKLRQGPYFAQGLIVEVVMIADEKSFSVCIAENTTFLLSYAYGCYSMSAEGERNTRKLSNSVVSLLEDAYTYRYGISQQHESSLFGDWNVKKNVYSKDGHLMLDGNYTMEIRNVGDSRIHINCDDISIDVSIDEVVSIGEYTEEQYWEIQGLSDMFMYEECYAIKMNTGSQQVFLVITKPDSQKTDTRVKLKLCIDGEVWSSGV